jgi:hypothetical protein
MTPAKPEPQPAKKRNDGIGYSVKDAHRPLCQRARKDEAKATTAITGSAIVAGIG